MITKKEIFLLETHGWLLYYGDNRKLWCFKKLNTREGIICRMYIEDNNCILFGMKTQYLSIEFTSVQEAIAYYEMVCV